MAQVPVSREHVRRGGLGHGNELLEAAVGRPTAFAAPLLARIAGR